MSEFEEVRKLVRLKRHETPGDAYFEQFVERFQRRQRSELLRRSGWEILRDRFSGFLSEFTRTERWAYGTAVVYIAGMSAFLALGGFRGGNDGAAVSASPAGAAPIPAQAPVEILVSRSEPSSSGSPKMRYVLDTIQPVSHEYRSTF